VITGFQPKLFALLKTYSRKDFFSDLIAGITVALVALPLAMAFGIASGVTPQAGLYTAIAGGFIVALLGGSRVQIAGPTGAFVVIVAGIVAKHGVSGLAMVTMMAGVLLLVLGITGLGNAVKFIPRPVVIGFTNGIAVLIASTQIKDLLGLKYAGNPSEFFERLQALVTHIGTIDPASVTIALATIAIVLVVPKILPRVPGPIVALVFSAGAVALFGLHVDTIDSRFGGIPSGLPHLELPQFRADLILPLLPSALTVAILAAVESLLSAVVADSLTGDRHNSNAELVAQGAANVLVPMVGGIPVTGAIARTGTNVRAGARSPVASMVHSLTLLAIVMVCAPLAKSIPLATLAAILLVVAYRIGEWREIAAILRLDKTAIAVWLVTFTLTVCADLTVAVEVGMALAALLYIYRISQTTTVSLVTPEEVEGGRAHVLQDKDVPPYVTILRIHGPFLFGTTEKLAEETPDLETLAPIVILRLRNMTALDATGLYAIETFSERLKRTGRTLLICGARLQPAQLIARADFVKFIGAENILPNVSAALERARTLADQVPLSAPM
jgi:SulP family sulfate permease